MKKTLAVAICALLLVSAISLASDNWVPGVRHAGSTTWSNQPSATTEFLGDSPYRNKVDLTNGVQARLTVNVETAGVSGSTLAVQYSTDQSTWNYLDGSSGPSVSISSTGLQVSSDVYITSGALADIYLRIVGSGGNGSASPRFGLIAVSVKPATGSALDGWTTFTASNSTWTTQPSATTEFLGATVHRTKADLTNSTQARLIVHVAKAGAGQTTKLGVQYSTDLLSWSYLDGSSGPNVAINTTGLKVSSWVTIATAGRTDVYVRIVGLNGNGTASPGFGTIELQTK